MPLTDTAVKKAKPGLKPVKLTDGKGLYLLVNPVGSKLWRWKYRVLGKEKVMSLGVYPDVSLAQARDGVDKARKILATGDDPMAIRKANKVATRTAAENSFETVARQWWAHWKPARSEQHAGQVMRRFEANVFPHIGARPVAEVQAPELVAMLRPSRRAAPTIWPNALYRLPAKCFAMPLRMGWPSATRPPTSNPATCWRHAKSRTLPASTVRNCPNCCATLRVTKVPPRRGSP